MNTGTRAVRGPGHRRTSAEPLASSISLASVTAYSDIESAAATLAGRRAGWAYRRFGHPNGRELEEAVAALEGAEDALACSSGMTAATVLFWSTLAPGDHVIASRELYGGTYAFLRDQGPRLGLEVSFVPFGIREIERALRPSTRAFVFETISNPLIRVVDPGAVLRVARRQKAYVFVDNTFATPILTRPLEWGADAVWHSGTKFLGGHADAVSGIIAARRGLIAQARRLAVGIGGGVSPLDAWLTTRGIRTLDLRVRRASENALRLARQASRSHPVFYPGLPGDACHRAARSVLSGGFGGVFSIDLGSLARAKRFVRDSRLFRLATSLGDVSTTLSHPASSSHAYLSAEERASVGVTDGLIRISTGIEDCEDLLAELRRLL